MHNFTFEQASTVEAAAGSKGRFIAGGTTLVDLMKLGVEQPPALVDVTALPLDQVEAIDDGPMKGGLRIGAMVRNSDLANHPEVVKSYPVLSQALLSGASPQLRNMATTGGNLLQKTRCVYFRDLAHACNKREPGTGCSAMDGHNRMLAILGTSEDCIASNPSDMNVALTALEATINIQGTKGERNVPIHEFYLLPGKTPNRETVLEPGDLITSVTLAAPVAGTRSLYLKLRDRAAYEFALASAAIVMSVEGGRVRHVRVALGGVGAKPWRSVEAERALEGKDVSAANFRDAAEEALKEARPRSENGFKVELAKRCLVRALTMATTTA